MAIRESPTCFRQEYLQSWWPFCRIWCTPRRCRRCRRCRRRCRRRRSVRSFIALRILRHPGQYIVTGMSAQATSVNQHVNARSVLLILWTCTRHCSYTHHALRGDGNIDWNDKEDCRDHTEFRESCLGCLCDLKERRIAICSYPHLTLGISVVVIGTS